MRGSYCGPSYDSKCDFTAKLVETVIAKMKRGKAADLDGITAEQYSHPLVACVLAKLFNGMVKLGHVPASFGQSYTIPCHCLRVELVPTVNRSLSMISVEFP